MTSPYRIPLEQAGRGRAESLRSLRSPGEQLAFLGRATKVVFGRDPYARIFSAYVDKLYSPNPFYWRHWALKAHALSRSPAALCGSQLGFAAFVRLVAASLARDDVHLRPVSEECRVCQAFYDVLGKLESAPADLDHASALLNVSAAFQRQPGYRTAAQDDAVLDSLKSAFSWKAEVGRCIPADQMGRRIWRKLQIRGVIDSAIAYPFQAGQVDGMSVDAFIAECRRAIAVSGDRGRLRRQKRQALEEAYLDVSPESIAAIQKVYALDFAAFGYPDSPDYISNSEYRSKMNRTNALQWDTPWVMH